MKRMLLFVALFFGLAVVAHAQNVYFGMGMPALRPVYVAPAYPVVYGPAYPVVYRPGYCGPVCQHERRERWRRHEWRERERRELRWRRDMCRHGYRRYCGW